MPISFEQATVYLALSRQHSEAGNPNIAMAFKNDGRILGYAVDDSRGRHDSRSAIVNLIQNRKSIDIIGATYVPTKRDLGMARMAKIRWINFLGGSGSLECVNRARPEMSSKWKAAKKISITTNPYNIPAPAQNTHAAARNWYIQYVKVSQPHSGKLNQLQRAANGYENARLYTHFNRSTTKLTLPRDKIFINPIDLVRDDPNALRDQIFLRLAWAIVGESVGIRDNKGPYPEGHSIGSVLRGPHDEILAWGLNTYKEHWSLHGEINLIQIYQNLPDVNGNGIGENDSPGNKPILYSTLEPCFMCAGMYSEAGDNLTCRFGQKDPGIKGSALGNNQAFLETTLGKLTTSALHSARRAIGSTLKELKTTELLNSAIKPLMQHAVQYYFDLVPDGPDSAPAKRNWITHETMESYIWENGLRLLIYINSDVLEKWKKRTDRYYIVRGQSFERT